MRPTNKIACDVCGQEREPSLISIMENERRIPGTRNKAVEPVAYCNDKAECEEAAPRFTRLLNKRQSAVASRQKRAVGE